MAIQIWVLPAFWEVPKKALIRRCPDHKPFQLIRLYSIENQDRLGTECVGGSLQVLRSRSLFALAQLRTLNNELEG